MSVMVKALSIHQPWATAVALGAKRVETRHWRAPQWLLGRPLLIHASKTDEWFRDGTADLLHEHLFPQVDEQCRALGWPEYWPLGALVAVARLVDCVPSEEFAGYSGYILTEGNGTRHHIELTERELALGNFAPGRFGWVLADVRALPVPIPYRGQQNIFPVPVGILPEGYRP